MTHVQKLFMKGFKSFAKPTELVFGKNFNCALGPNGSGKSNIMDALTFVLGKTSAKSMRAEKSANLIFNGGKKGGAMKEAEVSIYFDNSEKEFPINAATIKLTRIVREHGNSIYKINDETMTKQQVVEVLSTATIDPDGHNIILQGDIIHFMDMHPEERRQIIEEIAGISVYEDKKQKALNELGRVDQRISDAEIILTERSTYLRELKKDRDHALKYKELEENIKSNKATYLEMQVKEKNDKLGENEKKINEHNEGISKINNKISEVKQKITDKKSELETTNKEIEQKGEIESVALQKDIENLKTDNVRSSERLNTCKNELNRIDERKKQLNSGFRDIEKTIDGLEKSKIDLGNEEKKLVVDETEFESKIKDFKAKYGFGNQEELAELEKEIEKKEQFLFRLQEQRQDFLKEKYQIDAKVNNIKENIEKLKELEGKSNIKKFKTDIKDIEDRLKRLISEDSSLGAQLQKARINLRTKSEELSRWQFRSVGLKESSMGDIAVRKIIEMNKKGVYGTVSELGKVDSKYSLALEVAAGARIRSLVVEDDKIAADCIKFLKQNKLGTATFLPLNTIKPRKESNLTGNGIHGNAIELITFDAKFKDIFSYVFGGTVVVEDVETARKLGLGKARLVTLEGDLFELSGAIIGGYRRKSKGIGFQEKEADDNLGKLNSEVSELQGIISTLEKRKEELENEIKRFRTDKAGLEGEIIKAEKSLGGVNLDSLKKELSDLEKAEIHGELNKIESRISNENIALDPLKETRQKLRANAAGVGDSDAADNLTALENKKQLLHERVIQVRAELKNIESQITNIYLPEKEKTLQIIKQHEREFENFKKEAEDLNNLLKNQAASLKDKEKLEQKFQKDYKSLFERRIKINEEVQKLEGSISVEDIRIKEIQDRLNNLAINKAKLVAELEGINKEYEEFRGAKLRRGLAIEVLKDEIRRFEQSMRNMGNVNMRALEVYEGIATEFQDLQDKKMKLISEKEDVMKMMAEIETKKKGIFMKTYKIIAENFHRIFMSLSTKGEAFMELENKEDPLQGGLEINVRIAGNKYLDIKSLSGGEKTLTALAFIFAIQEHQPASFYLLDEVDAALDKKNSALLSQLIKKYSATAQYILISHNDSIISEADQIYGVSMQENGISKIISLKL